MATKVITGTIDGLRSLQDRSVKLAITTQELAPSDIGDLFAFQGKFAKVLITDANVISPDMAKATEQTEVEDWERKKSEGQRLRGVLFLLFQKDSESCPAFEMYYRKKMNAIIDHYKSKLE
jgi:hypothetical protein